jgi:hypothetical protein
MRSFLDQGMVDVGMIIPVEQHTVIRSSHNVETINRSNVIENERDYGFSRSECMHGYRIES